MSVHGSSVDALTLSRRAFLRLCALSCGVLATSNLTYLAGCASTRPRAFAPRRRVLADLHAHPQLAEWIEHEPVSVKIPGLGIFRLRKMKARMGRNPQTGEPIKIPARKKVGFSVAKTFKDTVLGPNRGR